MNGILGFSSLLEDDNITKKERKEFLHLIKISSEQLLRIITDIVDISKIEAGLIVISKTEININILLKNIYSLYEKDINLQDKKHDVTLKYNLSLKDTESNIFTDDVRLRQILINLINNSIKFTSKGKIIYGYKQKTINNKQFIEFYVHDTGIGIKKEKLKVIFEQFIQADNSHTREYGGTGLGLSISKGLVKLLGGTINVESKYKEYTNFTFSIPI